MPSTESSSNGCLCLCLGRCNCQAKQFLWKMLRKFHIMRLQAGHKGTHQHTHTYKKNAELTMCDFFLHGLGVFFCGATIGRCCCGCGEQGTACWEVTFGCREPGHKKKIIINESVGAGPPLLPRIITFKYAKFNLSKCLCKKKMKKKNVKKRAKAKNQEQRGRV